MGANLKLLEGTVSQSVSQFSSVSQSCLTLWPHESQHARPPCPSPTPGVHSDSLPSSQWCHPAISSSVVPFSSCLQSLPASESFPVSQLFTWGGQSTGVSASASFPPKKSQGWSPLQNSCVGGLKPFFQSHIYVKPRIFFIDFNQRTTLQRIACNNRYLIHIVF